MSWWSNGLTSLWHREFRKGIPHSWSKSRNFPKTSCQNVSSLIYGKTSEDPEETTVFQGTTFVFDAAWCSPAVPLSFIFDLETTNDRCSFEAGYTCSYISRCCTIVPKKRVVCGWQLTGQLGIGTAWHHSVCSLLLFALLDSTSRTYSALWRVSPSFEVPCNYGVRPRKLTWNLKIKPWKRRFLLKTFCLAYGSAMCFWL